MVIYTARPINKANSFSALNCEILEGIDNEDLQEDLLARTFRNRSNSHLIDFPMDLPDSPRQEDIGVDGATASESGEELVENFTNDPIPMDESI